jgi:hypothetical protein
VAEVMTHANLKLQWVASLALVVLLTVTTSVSAELVGYWAMNEASWSGTTGEVLDFSGKGHHGTAAYNATTVVDPDRGTVGAFDGSGDYVIVPAHQDFNLDSNGTISCWVNFADLTAATHRIIGGASYHETFLLNQYGDRLFTYWGSTGGPQTTTASGTFLADKWYHVAVTNDNGTLGIYIDGTLKTTASQGPTPYNWNHAIYMGGYPSTWTINGFIDDVAIWDDALAPARIMSIYNVPATLGLSYDLDDMQALWSVFDAGPGGFDVIDGMPWWYTDQLPGTPPAPGESYVYDDIMYVVLGSGVGLRTPEPSSLIMVLLALVSLTSRLPKRMR